MSTNWADFQNDVRNVLNATDSPVKPVDPPVKPPVPDPLPVDHKRIWLLALLVLAVTLGITILLSNSKTELDTLLKPVAAAAAVETPKVDGLQNLQKEVDSLKVRVKILGAVNNNNWSSYNSRQQSNDIVFIGKDWKMSQIPPNLQKTEADTKFLQEWSQ
jgi:hypothetical protein